jgi:flagellar biosynthesis/type III secretory pathway chaperone
MGLFSLDSASDALEDLLDKERAAVLAARFDVLDRLTAEKERLIGLVARGDADPDALQRLRIASERNGRLLAAMRAGVQAAQKRITALRVPNAPLQTYDASGRVQAMTGAPRGLGHRA